MDRTEYESPIGRLELSASEIGVTGIRYMDPNEPSKREDSANPHLKTLAAQLTRYFSGEAEPFTVPLDLQGTAFQKRVWQALGSSVSFGQVRSYGCIADSIGAPGAARAVGGANNRNPLPIVIPCHRIVGADRRLVGYAGGLERKEWLLRHEGTALSAAS